MAANSDRSTSHDQAELPHYLVVRFDPSDLPPGSVAFQDLSQLVQGLEDIIAGVLITDLEDAGGDAQDRIKAIDLVTFASTRGSYEIVITLSAILDFMTKVVGDAASSQLDPWNLLEVFAAASTAGVGAKIGVHVADELYTTGRAQLQGVISLLKNVHDSRLEPISRYMGSRVRIGLKRIGKVAARPGNLARPITITPDRKDTNRIILDDDFERGVRQFSVPPTQGPEVQAVGYITAWNSRGPYFRLKVAAFNRTLKCKHERSLDATVHLLSRPGQFVDVFGTAYYPAGVTPTPPPLYVEVTNIQPTSARLTQSYVESEVPSMAAGASKGANRGPLWRDTNAAQ